MVLPQPEPVVVPGGKVADVQTGSGEHRDLRGLPFRRGTDRQFRADRKSRWCESADRPPASRSSSSVARRSTIATSTPANASSPASISPVGPAPAITTACPVIAAIMRHRPGLAASPPALDILELGRKGLSFFPPFQIRQQLLHLILPLHRQKLLLHVLAVQFDPRLDQRFRPIHLAFHPVPRG